MREQEWETTGDVGAMIRFLILTRGGESIPTEDRRISQEEVRLFDEAVYAHCGLTIDEIGEQEAPPPGAADVLRCIRGNPWRQVDLDWRWFCKIHGEELDGARCGGCRGWPPLGEAEKTCAWVTPTVRMLAGSLGVGTEARVLDPLTLSAIADALEEAGCGPVSCRECIRGFTNVSIEYAARCPKCDCGKLPRPLLAHLRSPGPHYVGCHAVRALEGES